VVNTGSYELEGTLKDVAIRINSSS